MLDSATLPLAPSGEPSLLPTDATYSALWTDMPSYEMGDTSAIQKIVVHFRSRESVEEFAKLVGDRAWTNGTGSKITEQTNSMWFGRDEDYVAPSELIWRSESAPPLRYPIYVPSVGRWNDPRTARALEAIGVPHRVVVEPAQHDDYARVLGPKRLLVLPEDFSTRNTGSIPARNWIWDHAVAEGHERHWVVDDNVQGFLRVHRNRKIPVADRSLFCVAEDFTDRWENVALSGFNYMYLANVREANFPPFYLNTRVYSMILVNHALPHRWRGRYNEDTDLSLRALKDGWCTILLNAFLGDKAPTLTMKGGNTDTVYNTGDKRRAFAESLVEQHPDVARVVWRYERWHHEVDYSRFQANRLVPREGWRPPPDPEYGMRLVKRPVTTRYPQPPARPIAPVTLAPRADPPSTAAESADGASVVDLFAPDAVRERVGTLVAAAVTTTPLAGGRAHAAAPALVDGGGARLIPILEPRTHTRDAKLASALVAETTTAPGAVTLGPRGGRHAVVHGRPAAAIVQPSTDPFLAHHARRLAAAGRGRLAFDANEFDHTAKTSVGLDVEVYPNFFLVCFKRFSDGRRLAFEMSARSELDVEGIRGVMESNVTVSFNGFNYDLPIIRAALRGADVAGLHELSQAIVTRNERQPWANDGWQHVDLFEVNPSVKMGLKVLHGRLHGRWMVDLPFPPEEPLTPEQMNIVTLYCMNDLDATEGLRGALLGPLMMRDELGRRHGLDLLSKSDAQVGEAIVRARLGGRVGRPDPQFRFFRYTPPDFLKFRGKGLCEILAKIARETFTVDPGGKVAASDWMKDLKVTIGAETYSMGLGGLHSTEAHRAVFSDDKRLLLDVDASSQYPNIIIGLGAVGLHPSAAGPNFVRVYAEMVRERLEAKAAGDKVKADGLKIATNGCFGKLASPHSFLYAPDLFLATTLTGQLSLLMLTEMVEGVGATVVSANTDGLVIHCPRNCVTALDETLAEWEAAVGMTLERTAYSALYSSSVNTYLAVKEDGSTKRKGWIANPWAEGDFRGMMQKNPQMTVLSDAVVGRLTQGVPLETTINAASDPRAFVTVIQARGGASWRGARLGRVVRYYWSTDGEPIVYTDSGRRVAKTEGARPMMELADRLPADLDRERYIAEAAELLNDLGSGTNLI